MDKSTRIRLIQQVRDVLDQMRWEDVDLLLEEFGFGTFPEHADDLTLAYWLRTQGSNQDLIALGQHLAVPVARDAADGVSDSTAVATGAEPGRLFLFGSHLSTQRAFVGQVAYGLRAYGIELFVAHDSIPVDAEWQPEIADALRRCDAAVAFLHEGLHASYYCMQEIGWLLGRDVPIARLIFEEAPLALLGSKQGIPVHGRSAGEVASAILEYVTAKPELQPQLATSLVHAMKNSGSFRTTDTVWFRLREMDNLTAQQCVTLLEAAEENGQVFTAGVGGYNGDYYRSAVADYLEKQEAAEPLASRIARLRQFKDSGVAIRPQDV